MLTIGLTGPIGSGKGTVIAILKDKGFFAVSTSDEVRKEAIRRGLTHSREDLQKVGNEMRQTYGASIFAERVADTINEIRKVGQGEKVVIDGIRSPGEIKWLKKNYGVIIIGVTAEPQIRFDRITKRGRIGDPTSLSELIDREKKEGMTVKGQENQLKKCIELADIIVENDGTIDALKQKLEAILAEVQEF